MARLFEQTTSGGSKGLSVKGQGPRRPSVLIESLGRGSSKLPEDELRARRPRPHPHPLSCLSPPSAVLSSDSTRLDASTLHVSAYETRKDAADEQWCTRTTTGRTLAPTYTCIYVCMPVCVRATYFCRTRLSRVLLADFPSSRDPMRPSLLSTLPLFPARPPSALYPRGGQPLLFIPYSLFFILYIPTVPR